MNYNELETKLNSIIKDLSTWVVFVQNLERRNKDITSKEQELANRESIVEKEKVIARDRKEVLDAREKNIENQEARLQRLSKI